MMHHWMLLKKLIIRGVDFFVVQLICYWFRNQFSVIKWGDRMSRPFPVRNSCRQGGLLSRYFFAIFVDDLSKQLSNSGAGCRIGKTIINHISYADDFCLMASSIQSLKTLLKICEEYASNHGLIFNPSKTVCQCFALRDYDYSRPRIVFAGKSISWSDEVKYLGFDISCWKRDESEIMRRRREVYVMGNIITSRFGSCSQVVKKYLFTTFFTTIYCMSLWCPVRTTALDKIRVAYNDVFRGLFKYNRRCSVSQMMVENGIQPFNVCMRRAAYSLLCRVSSSENIIIDSIFNSRAFTCSSIFHSWRKLLICDQSENVCLYTISR